MLARRGFALVLAAMLAVGSVAVGEAVRADPAFVQVGTDLDGEAGSFFGAAVASSADGNRVAIGAPLNPCAPRACWSGRVRVFDWDGAAWIQVGADIDGEGPVDESGSSVAMSADGNWLAIGASRNSDAGQNAGHVRVFGWDGAAWVQVGADIDGEAADDRDTDFDGSRPEVALSAEGSRVAIGVSYNDGAGMNAGHVRVFDWDGAAWVQAGADIDGEAEGDQSGSSVALSADGDRVAIGARYNEGVGYFGAGHVRVFDWDGAAWVQAGADIDGEDIVDYTGAEVALSADGNRVAIGVPGNETVGGRALRDNSSGRVRVFDWDGAAWTQVGADIDGEALADQSGRAVALSADGNRLAIGAPGNDDSGNWAGHVRVFDWDSAAWTQVGADIDGEAERDSSGSAVALSADGNRIIIGASYNDEAGIWAGHVRVYDLIVSPPTTTTVAATTTTMAATTNPVATPGGETLPETGATGNGLMLAAGAIACGLALVATARRRTA